MGYLDPDYFLGGEMKIDAELSRRAVGELGEKIGLDLLSTAQGIHDLANTHMGSAIRVVTLQRGIDPREFAITAFGGAGPAHVVKVAELFEIPLAIIPPSPGMQSAYGLVVSDLVSDHVASVFMPLKRADPVALRAIFDRLEKEGRNAMGQYEEGVEIRVERSIGVRFASQSLDLAVPIEPGAITGETLVEAEADCRRRYLQTFGTESEDECFTVNCRLRIVGVVPKPGTEKAPRGDGDASRALKGRRNAWFGKAGFVETEVYDRTRLRHGDSIGGPAILEEPESTTICPPGYSIYVDEYLNVRITLNAPA